MNYNKRYYANLDFDMFSRPDLYPDYQTHERCIDAINYDPMLFKHIKNFTEELQLYVVGMNPFLIKWFTSPYSDEVKWKCIEKYPSSMKYIHNPSEEMIIHALENEQSPSSLVEILESLNNINDKMILTAVNNCLHLLPYIFKHFDTVIDEKLKIEILENNWNKECYYYIKGISDNHFSEWFNKKFNKLKLEYGVLE